MRNGLMVGPDDSKIIFNAFVHKNRVSLWLVALSTHIDIRLSELSADDCRNIAGLLMNMAEQCESEHLSQAEPQASA